MSKGSSWVKVEGQSMVSSVASDIERKQSAKKYCSGKRGGKRAKDLPQSILDAQWEFVYQYFHDHWFTTEWIRMLQ